MTTSDVTEDRVSIFRIYIDEVGNHDLNSADNPNERFLSLTGIILESHYTLETVIPQLDALKRRFFQRDPDEPIILHRKELINKRPPFQALRDPKAEQEFNEALLAHLESWRYTTITVVLDKREHRDRYQVWRFHPYHYCLHVMLERYVLFLQTRHSRGDVMVESRGGREDLQLKESYARLYHRGSDYIALEQWQRCLTSKNLKVKPKSANIAGLQLADLIAHPSRREILLDHGLIEDDRPTFGDQICAIQRAGKYNRNRSTGKIEGYGKKLLP